MYMPIPLVTIIPTRKFGLLRCVCEVSEFVCVSEWESGLTIPVCIWLDGSGESGSVRHLPGRLGVVEVVVCTTCHADLLFVHFHLILHVNSLAAL